MGLTDTWPEMANNEPASVQPGGRQQELGRMSRAAKKSVMAAGRSRQAGWQHASQSQHSELAPAALRGLQTAVSRQLRLLLPGQHDKLAVTTQNKNQGHANDSHFILYSLSFICNEDDLH